MELKGKFRLPRMSSTVKLTNEKGPHVVLVSECGIIGN